MQPEALGFFLNELKTGFLALTHLLTQEKEALQKNEPQLLTTLADRKHELLTKLDALDYDYRKKWSFTPEQFRSAVDVCLSKLEPTDAALLQKLWEETRMLSVLCQKQNMMNGAVISRNARLYRYIASFLQPTPESDVSTYDGSGKVT